MKPVTDIRGVVDKIVGTLAEADSNESIDHAENLFTVGYLDSVGAMQLVEELEKSFGTKIPAKDLVPRNFMSIEAMTVYFERRRKEIETNKP
ncbi:MAG: acyl carrier protein [Verrucomicrobiota bacterium]